MSRGQWGYDLLEGRIKGGVFTTFSESLLALSTLSFESRQA